MKKILLTIYSVVALGVLLSAMQVGQAQTAGAYFELRANATSFTVGDQFSVDIIVHPNGAQLNVARAVINFPQNILQVDDFDIGNDFPFMSPPGPDLDNTNGIVNVGGFLLNDAVTSNAVLGTLTFTVIGEGTANADIVAGSHLITPDQTESLNIDASIDLSFTVGPPPPPPNQEPQFTGVGTQNVTVGNTVAFTVSANDPDGDSLSFTDVTIPENALFDITSETSLAEGLFSWTPDSEGTYQTSFTVTDNDSTDPKSKTLAVTINVNLPTNSPPSFIPIGSRNIDIGETVNFGVTASDPDGDTLDFSWNIPQDATFTGVVNNAPNVSGNFSWTATQEGNFFATFSVVDDSAFGPQTVELQVPINVAVPGNTPPSISSVPEIIVNAGEPVSFEITSTDNEGDTISFTAELPEGATFSVPGTGSNLTGTFDWTPQESGLYWILFTAQDDNPFTPLSRQRSVRISVFGGTCPVITQAACGVIAPLTCPDPEVIIDIPIEDLECPVDVTEFEPTVETYPLPILSSETHPDSQVWYNSNTVIVSWTNNPGVQGHSITIDTFPDASPGSGTFPREDNEFTFQGLSSGIWYVHLRDKYDFGWSNTAHYEVRIDTEPPAVLTPFIETRGVSELEKEHYLQIQAKDSLSGISHYELSFDNAGWEEVTVPYIIPENYIDAEFVRIRVFDSAGNATEKAIFIKDAITRSETAVPFTETQPILPPLIREKIPEEYVGAIMSKKSLIFSGSGPPNAVITVHIRSEEITAVVKTDKDGNWVYYHDTPLEQGEHIIWTTASINGVTSPPSEIVFFNLEEDFSTDVRINRESFFYLAYVILAIIIGLSFHSWRLHNKLKKEKKRNKNV